MVVQPPRRRSHGRVGSKCERATFKADVATQGSDLRRGPALPMSLQEMWLGYYHLLAYFFMSGRKTTSATSVKTSSAQTRKL